MKTLNEKVLRNLLTEREMAYAKRTANIHANLPTDRLDRRIEVLNAAIDEHHKMILIESKSEMAKT